MSDQRVEFVGLPAATADIERWAGELAGAVARAGEPFAVRVADIVRDRVPYLTGQLAGSVDTASDEDGIGVGLGNGVPYAGWIEFGGGRGRPYIDTGRYLYPSALAAQDEFAALAADTAEDTVSRFSWSTPSH